MIDFALYAQPAPSLSFWEYAKIGLICQLFWVLVHTVSHFVFMRYNSVYQQKTPS
jgi:hypothetical protein